MNATLPADVLKQIEREQQHFDLAPYAFFQAWRFIQRRLHLGVMSPNGRH